MHTVFAIQLILIFVIVVALLLLLYVPHVGHLSGGAERSSHVVVDTLNLAHWWNNAAPSGVDDIIVVIKKSAKVLHDIFTGRLMYVVKDRENIFNDQATRDKYQQAAIDAQCVIYIVERYVEPPREEKPRGQSHGQLGRDDFYMGVLAWKYNCSVLTNDKMRDYTKLRHELDAFHVHEYTYWRACPQSDQVNPASPAYINVKKPRTIPPGKIIDKPHRCSR